MTVPLKKQEEIFEYIRTHPKVRLKTITAKYGIAISTAHKLKARVPASTEMETQPRPQFGGLPTRAVDPVAFLQGAGYGCC